MKHDLKNAVGLSGAVAASLFLHAGCAATEGDDLEALDVDLDGIEAQQLVSVTNADGTWTLDAKQPVTSTISGDTYIRGKATFSGPAGKVAPMGLCLLKQKKPVQNCTTETQCGTGTYYCAAPNGVGTKTCWIRGATASYCAGTPATGTLTAPGTYETPNRYAGSNTWISYACFAGCSGSDPSSSSYAETTKTCQMCGQYCC